MLRIAARKLRGEGAGRSIRGRKVASVCGHGDLFAGRLVWSAELCDAIDHPPIPPSVPPIHPPHPHSCISLSLPPLSRHRPSDAGIRYLSRQPNHHTISDNIRETQNFPAEGEQGIKVP